LKTFLDRARLTLKGVITRTTMLLVGKELSAHLLSPHPAQIVWKLVGEEQANEIFYPPFLLATNSVYSRIRNVQIRILPDGELFQKEVPKYVPKSILEALHNCIAHQDYRRCARILVTEYVDRVQFESQGCFFEGKPEEYIAGNKTPSHYRNLQLVQAMREINMIDTQGYGIHRLYEEQRKRYFPMPDYELKGDSVKTTIYGHVVDVAYSSLLIRRTDLKLDDVCLLDRIQKNLPVDAHAVAHLRKAGLIEGRFPHLHISAKIAAATDQKAAYMRKKELSGKQYRKLITDYLAQFESLTRKEIDDYMLDEIRGELSESEKKSKISNLLTYLRRKGDIVNVGSDAYPLWKLTDKIECQ
jgi:ATP-dependent DNA helicase RecG